MNAPWNVVVTQQAQSGVEVGIEQSDDRVAFLSDEVTLSYPKT